MVTPTPTLPVYTDDEARLMRCCGPEGCGQYNELPYRGRWCIAASCMAWVWDGHRYTKDYGTQRAGQMVDDANPPTAASVERFPLDHVGHCGLRNQP